MSEHTYPNNTPVKLVDCKKVFNDLTDKQKLYAHFLSKASFYGSLIVLPQTSLESSVIFVLLHKLFKAQPISELKQIALQKCGFKEEEFQALLAYTCGFLGDMGNYKGFGDIKFIPDLPKEKFHKLVVESKANEKDPETIKSLLVCLDPMFSLKDGEKQLGFPNIGKTTYLSKNITQEDLKIVKDFFKNQKLEEPYNTRLFKTKDNQYEIRLASVLKNVDDKGKSFVTNHTVNGHKFSITRGDYSELLDIVNKYLMQAKNNAANENQVKMIEHYIQSFHTGSLKHHKDGSRFWIKDKGPVVENYIGFIETYRDPDGIRGEFEGFVAIVNKEQSLKFQNLVNGATNYLPVLPWPAEYEKDEFLCPDFTSLEVMTFAGSGIPIGINIPNYDEIKQNEGFKNVYLSNIISARSKHANFVSAEDEELMNSCVLDSLEVVVGLHELLGHGSGKLFEKKSDGSYNFDFEKVKHLETNEKVTSFYEEGDTYDTIFGSISSPYEECRAECVALYLCLDSEVMKVFGHEGPKAEKVVQCIWLEMLLKGLESLRMYEPKTESWLQSHCRARYVILQVCLEAGQGFVKIQQTKGSDGNPDLLISVDYSKIQTVGKKAIGDFLRKLQLYKATADVKSAKAMFDKYSAVTSEDKYPFLTYREIVLARKKPRDVFAQFNTFIKDNKVELNTYEASFDGLIKSFVDRYDDYDIDSILMNIWKEDKAYFE